MARPDAARIVVTGLGVVSSLSCDVEGFHRALAAGRSGIRAIDVPHPTGYRTTHAGVVDDFDPARFGSSSAPGRTAAFALAAASAALDDAGARGRPRTGVVVGTAMGEGLEWEQSGERPRAMTVHETVARGLALDGPAHLVCTTCAAGNHCVDWGRQLLRTGEADAVVAIGVDTIGFVDLLGFARLLLQAPDRCRPFDLHRKGTILAEGAAAVVLERLSDARARGAPLHAEIAGCGLSCDAGGAFKGSLDDVAPLLHAAHAALREAELSAEAIDWIVAHGSGTRLNDARETRFARALLGSRADDVPMCGLKSMLGHAQGAAATQQLVAAALALRHDVIYPTIHLQTRDPACDLDYVTEGARPRRVDTILSNAFGIGGNNAIVVVRRIAA